MTLEPRPRSVAELLALTLRVVGQNAGKLLLLSVATQVPFYLLFRALQTMVGPPPETAVPPIRPWTLWLSIVLILCLPPPLLAGAGFPLVHGSLTGLPVALGDCARTALRRLAALLIVGVLTVVAPVAWLAPTGVFWIMGEGPWWLLAIPFAAGAVWVKVRWYFALPVVVAEGLGPLASLQRSRVLGGGLRWRILAFASILDVVPGAISWPIGLWARAHHSVWRDAIELLASSAVALLPAVGAMVMYLHAHSIHGETGILRPGSEVSGPALGDAPTGAA